MRVENEVKPDGHGEATRDHELNLHELALIGIHRPSPISYPTGLDHGGLELCG